MDLYRIAVKLPAQQASGVELTELVPVFHRWIQTSAVDGLLIDVADYAHVHQGPGIMLIAHEGHYAMDLGDGRLGLQYERKRPMQGGLEERLASVCRTALRACAQLEEAPELGGRLKFAGDELRLVAGDRLVAPNDERTAESLRPAIAALAARLYGGASCDLQLEPDPRERFAMTIKTAQPVPLSQLLQRLSSKG
jgi:hypothetical protein